MTSPAEDSAQNSAKVMLLAAGRGIRLSPITDTLPKPLIAIGTETLIERHIVRLAQAGFKDIVINVSYLREMLYQTLGDGRRYGVRILWSDEGDEKLGTGGGIANALPLLSDTEILVINSDIYTDWTPKMTPLKDNCLAHLLMVDNPDRHQGDFSLENGKINLDDRRRLTFSGIGYYHPSLFKLSTAARFQLAEVLKILIQNGQVSGERFTGFWADAGTHTSLERLRNRPRD